MNNNMLKFKSVRLRLFPTLNSTGNTPKFKKVGLRPFPTLNSTISHFKTPKLFGKRLKFNVPQMLRYKDDLRSEKSFRDTDNTPKFKKPELKPLPTLNSTDNALKFKKVGLRPLPTLNSSNDTQPEVEPTVEKKVAPSLDFNKNWDKLVARNYGVSTSVSHSDSFSGLPSSILNKIINNLAGFPSLSGLANSIATGQYNPSIYENLGLLNKIALENYQKNLRPVIDSAFRQGITNLSNRGVLDSSVASHTLGRISDNYLSDLSNFASNLEMERINRAINYPITAFSTLAGVLTNLANASRYSRGSSNSTGMSVSGSYNPTPAVGFLSSLLL